MTAFNLHIMPMNRRTGVPVDAPTGRAWLRHHRRMKPSRSASPVLLYLLHCGNLYGTERMALATLEQLPDYRCVVFAPPPAGPASVANAAQQAGYESVVFSSRWGLVRALIPWFLKYRSIDVIGTGVVHTAVCYALAKLFRVKLRQLHVAHGGTPSSFNQKRALNRFPVTVVAVSQFVKNQLVQLGLREDRVAVIGNFLSDQQRAAGVPRPRFDRPSPGGRLLDPTRVKVAVVSRIDPMKRVDLLIQAIEFCGLREFQFDIYGVGTAIDDLKQRAARFDNIRFHGYVPDVNRRLEKADVLLHLCPDEPFGLAILEGFLAKLVVIVPDAGGSSDLVHDGITGLRYAANDETDLVRVLHRTRGFPPAALQTLAEAGNATLDGVFSPAVGAQRYREELLKAGMARG